ncbi:MAG: TFIIB-type zinc ribbon-containing protein [Nitrososphaerales archaeon]|nr:TFIIB-type zinc ribbon-containing protein [Nitrososphaerales archaeon]
MSVSVCPNCWSANFELDKKTDTNTCSSCGNLFKRAKKL